MPVINVKTPEIARLDVIAKRDRELEAHHEWILDQIAPRIGEEREKGWGGVAVLLGALVFCILGLRLVFYITLGV